MIQYGPPEKVHVELEWYDGPRFGIADINGIPHRFKSLFDETNDEYLGIFVVWPIATETLALEIEQWEIFVEWNSRYERGEVSEKSHPGHGRLNPRWDELDKLLAKSRSEVPVGAKKALAQLERLNREGRYESDGADYTLCWCFL